MTTIYILTVHNVYILNHPFGEIRMEDAKKQLARETEPIRQDMHKRQVDDDCTPDQGINMFQTI